MRFLGLGLSDKVPDAKTIWLFRETLKNSGAAEELFSVFRDHLQAEGIITHTGSIVDASIIERRRQHIGKEAYTQLKEGKTPDEWQKPENQNKVRQIDKEARITIKNKKMLYGYKLHSKVDADSKCIVKMKVTPLGRMRMTVRPAGFRMYRWPAGSTRNGVTDATQDRGDADRELVTSGIWRPATV